MICSDCKIAEARFKGMCKKCYHRDYYHKTSTRPKQKYNKDVNGGVCFKCSSPSRAEGLCNKHYLRQWSNRPVNPTRDMTDKERFLFHVDKADECWLWSGGKFDNGYGAFWFNKKTIGAHRFSYLIHKGEISDELYVLHKCDNPPCVNPDHLFLGTPKDNMTDKIEKGRGNYPKGEKHHRSKLSDDQVRDIYKMNKTMTHTAISKVFGVSRSLISMVAEKKHRIVNE